jgi:phosphopentomutase
LHGVSPFVHGQFTGGGADPIPDNSAFPSVFRVLSEGNLSGVSIGSWPPINRHFIESNLPLHRKYISQSDRATAKIFKSFFGDKGGDASLVFVDFDECDVAGHRKGYFTLEQEDCLVYIDHLIGDMLSEIRRLPGENYFIVTTDHGGGGLNPYGHGSDRSRDMTIFWACSGPGIPKGVELQGAISILDTPVVISTILRRPIPQTWEGQVPAQIKAAAR